MAHTYRACILNQAGFAQQWRGRPKELSFQDSYVYCGP